MIESKKRPLQFWAGGKATFAWFLYLLVPLRVRIWMMARRFGLIGFARDIAAK